MIGGLDTFTVLDNDTITVNLKVALVWVHNHVEVLIATEHLGQHIAETLFEHAYQRSAIDVLCLFELLKGLKHAGTFCFFLCCHFLSCFFI